MRETLEPLFIKHNVSIVFTGHDHIYERMKPQQGITHFVDRLGRPAARRRVRRGTSRSRPRSSTTSRSFLVAEIFENEMTFNAVSRTGAIVDSGIVVRRELNSS